MCRHKKGERVGFCFGGDNKSVCVVTPTVRVFRRMLLFILSRVYFCIVSKDNTFVVVAFFSMYLLR